MALSQTSQAMTLTGMDTLLQALRAMPDVAKQELKQVVSVTAFAIGQRMKATVPRNTGVLSRSIFSSARGMTGRVEIGVEAFYWPFVEFGTVKMAARPFIRTAAEMEWPEFERRLKDAARAIEREFERRG